MINFMCEWCSEYTAEADPECVGYSWVCKKCKTKVKQFENLYD